jgi:6-pyruvoyltetrahydropterin/6-carboxytetrahydropterin synthase
MKADVFREFTFEAAHRNGSAPPGAINGRLHGHSYRAVVIVRGEVEERLGWLVDFADIKDICKPVIVRLDHRNLNEIAGMNDTSCADLSLWLSAAMAYVLPGFARCEVSIVGDTTLAPRVERDNSASETADRVCFGFAAAHYLPEVPADHKCRRMHGHSFEIQVAAKDPDALLPAIERIYPDLDHRVLNEVPGLENPTSEILARWIWNALSDSVTDVHSVTVKETCTSGCVYRGED